LEQAIKHERVINHDLTTEFCSSKWRIVYIFTESNRDVKLESNNDSTKI